LDLLQEAIERAITKISEDYNAPELKTLIVDIEICGSYAYGNQRWWSDFDVQLPAKDYDDQRKIEDIIANKSSLVKTVGSNLAKELKHSIELHYSVHDNKEYNEVYSLRERKLYNREERTKRNNNFQRRFKSKTDSNGKEIGKYEVKLRTPPFCEGDYWDVNGDEKFK